MKTFGVYKLSKNNKADFVRVINTFDKFDEAKECFVKQLDEEWDNTFLCLANNDCSEVLIKYDCADRYFVHDPYNVLSGELKVTYTDEANATAGFWDYDEIEYFLKTVEREPLRGEWEVLKFYDDSDNDEHDYFEIMHKSTGEIRTFNCTGQERIGDKWVDLNYAK